MRNGESGVESRCDGADWLGKYKTPGISQSISRSADERFIVEFKFIIHTFSTLINMNIFALTKCWKTEFCA